MSAKKYNLIKQVSNNTVSYYANVYFAGNKWDVIFNYMKDGRLYCVSFIHTETTPENRKAFNQVLLDRLVNKYGLPSCYEDDKDWIFEWSDSITEVSVSYSNTIFSYYTMLSYRDIQLFNSKHACDELEL